MLHAFRGCWHRIKRADAQRGVLARAWNRFIEKEPYAVSVHMHRSGAGWIKIRPKAVIPDQFSLYLGEILYHFRAALDECIYRAVSLYTGQDPPPDEKHLIFPFVPIRAKLQEATQKLPLPDQLRAVIESVQAYNIPELPPEQQVFDASRALGILHRWARIDRHRRLHVLASWASNLQPKVATPAGVLMGSEVNMTVIPGFLKYEREVAHFQIPRYQKGTSVFANPNLALDIAVDETPAPCADNDILRNRLEAISCSTRAIIRTFERFFESRQQRRG